MYIGSLAQTINESTENYINSIYLSPDDDVCILGEIALHHTLEEHDVSYLWEFALNEDNSVTNDGTYTKDHRGLGKYLNTNIDLYHTMKDSAIKNNDEASFNANKTTMLNRIESKIKELDYDKSKGANNGDLLGSLRKFKARIQDSEFPKSWLAKKIQWFRSLYAKFMNKNKVHSGTGLSGFFKLVLANITRIIDLLLEKIQHAVN